MNEIASISIYPIDNKALPASVRFRYLKELEDNSCTFFKCGKSGQFPTYKVTNLPAGALVLIELVHPSTEKVVSQNGFGFFYAPLPDRPPNFVYNLNSPNHLIYESKGLPEQYIVFEKVGIVCQKIEKEKERHDPVNRNAIKEVKVRFTALIGNICCVLHLSQVIHNNRNQKLSIIQYSPNCIFKSHERNQKVVVFLSEPVDKGTLSVLFFDGQNTKESVTLEDKDVDLYQRLVVSFFVPNNIKFMSSTVFFCVQVDTNRTGKKKFEYINDPISQRQNKVQTDSELGSHKTKLEIRKFLSKRASGSNAPEITSPQYPPPIPMIQSPGYFQQGVEMLEPTFSMTETPVYAVSAWSPEISFNQMGVSEPLGYMSPEYPQVYGETNNPSNVPVSEMGEKLPADYNQDFLAPNLQEISDFLQEFPDEIFTDSRKSRSSYTKPQEVEKSHKNRAVDTSNANGDPENVNELVDVSRTSEEEYEVDCVNVSEKTALDEKAKSEIEGDEDGCNVYGDINKRPHEEDFEIRSKRMAIRLAHTVAFNEDHCTGVMEGQIRQLHETLTAVDEMGDLPLGNAFLKSHTKSATFLMNLMSEFRIPFNYTNFSGHSFLILLANSQCSESFAPSLIAGDCDVTAKDHLHRNVLHYAVHNKRIGLLNYLLENHRSSHSLLTERDAHNMSPLHLAVFHEDSPQILNICLQYCSDVNHESNVEGETSLFIAMSNSCEKSAMILLKDPRVDVEISCAGRNLLTLAFERKLCAEIADLIRLRKDQASGLTAIINSLERIDINKLAVDKVYETVDSLTISQCHLLGDQIAQTRMLHLSTSDVSRLKSLKITTSDGQSRMMLKSFLKHLNPPVNLALVHQLMMEIIKK